MDSHAEVIEAASRDAAPPSASSAAPLVPAPPRVYPASAASAPSAAKYGPGPALLAALQASKLGLEATCPYDGAASIMDVEKVVSNERTTLVRGTMGLPPDFRVRQPVLLKQSTDPEILVREFKKLSSCANPFIINLASNLVYYLPSSSKGAILLHAAEGSLNDIILDPECQPSGREVQVLACSIFNGLFYLHYKANIIHKDIKPDNVLYFNNPEDVRMQHGRWNFKICDFGAAVTCDHDGLAVKEDDKFRHHGTPKYMAPEVWDKHTRYDARLDVFSSGLTILEFAVKTTAIADQLLQAHEQHEHESGDFRATLANEVITEMLSRYILRLDKFWPLEQVAAVKAFLSRCLACPHTQRPTSRTVLLTSPLLLRALVVVPDKLPRDEARAQALELDRIIRLHYGDYYHNLHRAVTGEGTSFLHDRELASLSAHSVTNHLGTCVKEAGAQRGGAALFTVTDEHAKGSSSSSSSSSSSKDTMPSETTTSNSTDSHGDSMPRKTRAAERVNAKPARFVYALHQVL